VLFQKSRDECIFRNDRRTNSVEDCLEVEKADWNVFIGFGNIGVVGDHWKRLSEEDGEETRSDLNCLMGSEKVERVFVDLSCKKFS